MSTTVVEERIGRPAKCRRAPSLVSGFCQSAKGGDDDCEGGRKGSVTSCTRTEHRCEQAQLSALSARVCTQYGPYHFYHSVQGRQDPGRHPPTPAFPSWWGPRRGPFAAASIHSHRPRRVCPRARQYRGKRAVLCIIRYCIILCIVFCIIGKN